MVVQVRPNTQKFISRLLQKARRLSDEENETCPYRAHVSTSYLDGFDDDRIFVPVINEIDMLLHDEINNDQESDNFSSSNETISTIASEENDISIVDTIRRLGIDTNVNYIINYRTLEFIELNPLNYENTIERYCSVYSFGANGDAFLVEQTLTDFLFNHYFCL